jgi:hypothetical protein
MGFAIEETVMNTCPKIFLLAAIGGLCINKADGVSITTLYNTGVSGSGVVLPDGTIGDPHYTLVSVPSGSTAIRVITADGFPIPPYFGDNALSRWIGPNNAGTAASGDDDDLISPPGSYIYRTTFDLTGLNLASAFISGGWSSDNDGVDIRLNGVSFANLDHTGTVPTSFTQFSIGFAPFSISSGFIPGINTLDFVIHNGGSSPGNSSGAANPTALRVQMTGTAAVPDGGLTVALLGMSLTGLAYFRRKFA